MLRYMFKVPLRYFFTNNREDVGIYFVVSEREKEKRKNILNVMEKNRFHRHFPVKGYPLYWIIIAYIVVGWFFPVVGLIALVCMVGPVATSVWKGRYWCGNVCPRGNFFDRVLSRYSPHRPIPRFVRTVGFRTFMVCFIFAMFGIQMYFAWGDWNAMGRVFWNIIVATSVVAVVLAFVYAPRTWCSFCPMGCMTQLICKAKQRGKPEPPECIPPVPAAPHDDGEKTTQVS